MPHKTNPTFAGSIVLAISICTLVAEPANGQSQDKVVPVTAEANHRIRFDNGKVRMYEVELQQGKATAFHEHVSDSFAVILNTTSRANDPKDGQRSIAVVKAGQVGFASTAKGPYSHRIEATAEVPYHVIAMELLSPGNLGTTNGAKKRFPPFDLAVQENPRGQAYRLILKPGESTGPFDRPANTAIFAIPGGRTSEVIDGKAPRLWDSNVGSFRWTDEPSRLTIRNEGTTEVDFIEIEVF